MPLSLNVSPPVSSAAQCSLIFVDLQHYFLNQVSDTPQQRAFFENITEKCLAVEKVLEKDVPSVHVFSEINAQRYYYPMLSRCKDESYRRAYEQARQKVFYDSRNFTVHTTRDDAQSDLVNTTYIEPLYPVNNKKIIFKTSHSGFTNSGHDDLDHVLEQQQSKEGVLVGAFANNCIWATALDGSAHGYNMTVLADCVASRESSLDEETLIAENMALFAGLKNVRCITSDAFIAEIQNKARP